MSDDDDPVILARLTEADIQMLERAALRGVNYIDLPDEEEE